MIVEPGGRSATVGLESCSTVVRLPAVLDTMVSPAGSAPLTDVFSVLNVLIDPIAGVELTLRSAGLFSTAMLLLPAGVSPLVLRGGLT